MPLCLTQAHWVPYEKACIVSEIINELPKYRRVRSFLKFL